MITATTNLSPAPRGHSERAGDADQCRLPVGVWRRWHLRVHDRSCPYSRDAAVEWIDREHGCGAAGTAVVLAIIAARCGSGSRIDSLPQLLQA
jgi:hypothetical protein